MNILIDNKSSMPIYDQIYTQMRAQILDGALRENDALPSIRNLAKDLRISVITTKRAYDELEREGLIYAVAGKGCFVAGQNAEFVREAKLRRLEECLQTALVLAAACGVSKNEMKTMLDVFSEEVYERN